jgi:uncharacterized protein
MQLNNSFTVPLPAGQAWPVLLDVERVVGCMPGVTLDAVDGDDILARMKVKLGPIQLTYQGKARFLEKDESGRRLVIEASGKDTKGAGTASATVQMSLHERGDESEVHLLTDLMVTGKPAQFGRGAIQEVTSKLVDRFAKSLEDELAPTDSGGATLESTSGSNGAAPRRVAASPRTAGAARRPADDHLDLRDVMGPIAKRLAPIVGGALLLVVLVVILLRR